VEYHPDGFVNRCGASAYLSFLLAFLAAGCGDNLQTNTIAVTLSPPRDLKAYSAGDATVNLTWSASPDAVEPTFLGYIVGVGGVEDSVSSSSLSHLAEFLSAGTKTFSVFSYRSDGPRSSGTTIRWAAASRFDTPTVLMESTLQDPTHLSGLNVGSQSTDPAAFPLEPIDSSVINLMDMYLFGGSGQISAPLAFWSAHWLLGTLKQSKFSTVSHSSTSLDYPLASFPGISSFVRDTVAISDNTIYYVKIQGDNLDTLYARIHVRIVPGLVFPNRAVEIRISLQRVPGVLFANSSEKGILRRRNLQTILSDHNHNSQS